MTQWLALFTDNHYLLWESYGIHEPKCILWDKCRFWVWNHAKGKCSNEWAL